MKWCWMKWNKEKMSWWAFIYDILPIWMIFLLAYFKAEGLCNHGMASSSVMMSCMLQLSSYCNFHMGYQVMSCEVDNAHQRCNYPMGTHRVISLYQWNSLREAQIHGRPSHSIMILHPWEDVISSSVCISSVCVLRWMMKNMKCQVSHAFSHPFTVAMFSETYGITRKDWKDDYCIHVMWVIIMYIDRYFFHPQGKITISMMVFICLFYLFKSRITADFSFSEALCDNIMSKLKIKVKKTKF